MNRKPVLLRKCVLGHVERSDAPDPKDQFEENALFGMHAIDRCFERAAKIGATPQERYLLVVRAIAEAQVGKRDESLEGAISVLFVRHYGISHLDRLLGI